VHQEPHVPPSVPTDGELRSRRTVGASTSRRRFGIRRRELPNPKPRRRFALPPHYSKIPRNAPLESLRNH
jgi:hypothetical protein